MNELAHIIQLIATAINSKLTLTLSERIKRLSAEMKSGGGKSWIDRTPAGKTIQDRRISESNNALSKATVEHATAHAEAMKSAGEFAQEQASPTGRDLAALGKAAEETRKKMEAAAVSLADIVRENDRLKAASLSRTHEKRIEKSGTAVEKATAYKQEAQSRYSSVRNAITEEQTNPTGMDPAEMARLEFAAATYRVQLDQASETLKKVTGEHGRLRQSIDRQIDASKVTDEGDSAKLRDAYSVTQKATTVRDVTKDAHDEALGKLADAHAAPAGVSPAELQKLTAAVASYAKELGRAETELKGATDAESAVRKAAWAKASQQTRKIEKKEASRWTPSWWPKARDREDAPAGIDPDDSDRIQRAAKKTATAATNRDQLQDKYNSSRNAVTEEVLNPTGMSPAKLQKLADAVTKYEKDLEAADAVLKKLTTAEDALQHEILNRTKAQKSADERKPKTAFGQKLREANVAFRKAIGSKGRKALKPFDKRVKQAKKFARDVADPKKARERTKAAREKFKTADTAHRKAKSAFSQAQAEHEKAVDLHQRAPSAASAKGVAESSQKLAGAKTAVETTGKAAATAGEELAAAEAMGVIAEASAGLAEALGPVGVAIGVVAAAAVAAVVAINRQLEAGKKEVERYRGERSRFSSQVAGAVAKYDQQSIDLERRSSQATQGSAAGVTASTMALRESNQDRSEKWEEMSNQLLATTLDMATDISEVVNAIDIITPVAQASLTVSRDTLKLLGFRLRDIADNTKKGGVIDFEALRQGMQSNKDHAPRKIQNKEIPPLRPVR